MLVSAGLNPTLLSSSSLHTSRSLVSIWPMSAKPSMANVYMSCSTVSSRTSLREKWRASVSWTKADSVLTFPLLEVELVLRRRHL